MLQHSRGPGVGTFIWRFRGDEFDLRGAAERCGLRLKAFGVCRSLYDVRPLAKVDGDRGTPNRVGRSR